MIWHSSGIEAIKKELQFDEKQGLTGAEVAERIKKYGENRIFLKKGKSFSKVFTKYIFETRNILLTVLSIILLITGIITQKPLWFSPLFIIILIAINSVSLSFAEIRNQNLTNEINDKFSVSAKVLREGSVATINAALLVPGDIVFLEAGDYIPADGRLLEENSLICDESALTGDSAPNEKNTAVQPDDICPLTERRNTVYSGCSVIYGRGLMVVTDTGKNTELGKQTQLKRHVIGNDTDTKRKLFSMGKSADIAVTVFASILFILGIIFIPLGKGEGFSDLVFGTLTLSVSVSAICLYRTLPGTVTSAISFATKGMLSRNAVVKNPHTVETLSMASVIISDKTGTLTRNRMKMTSVWSGGEIIDLYTDDPDENTVTLIRTGALCCNGKIAFGSSGKERQFGDPTEVGIVAACQKYCGLSKEELENIYPRMADVPFDSKRKLMTTVNMINNKPFAIVKGAPDILFSCCTAGNLNGASEAAVAMGQTGQRVIGVAIKPLDEVPANPNPDNLECDLTLLGLFGMTDYISHSTKQSLAECEKAGIRVIMVTGDHITTASAIAKELKILKEDEQAITGAELAALTDEELKNQIRSISVYCRISDSDKIRIVKAWQDLGETVALTGDSVEDAAALKQADIGCAMGITGTDISKGSADIILTDDSFISIVNAIKTGRNTFFNIRHAVQLILAGITGEILTLLLGLFIFKTAVIPTVGLLAVNTIFMLVLSRALTAEPDRKNSMNVKPREKKEGILHSLWDFDFVWQGILLSVLTLLGCSVFGNAATFTFFAFGLMFLTLALKNCCDFYHEGIKISKNMLIGLGAAFILLLIIVIPVFAALSVGTISSAAFFAAVGFGIAVLIVCEAVKLIRYFITK